VTGKCQQRALGSQVDWACSTTFDLSTKFNESLEPKLESLTLFFACGRGDAARLRILA
jgi:hypothetical protein